MKQSENIDFDFLDHPLCRLCLHLRWNCTWCAVAPERVWKWGRGTRLARSARNFFVAPVHCFGSTISRFGVRFRHFRDGQYSLVSFLFAVLLLTVPPEPYRIGANESDYVRFKLLQSVLTFSRRT